MPGVAHLGPMHANQERSAKPKLGPLSEAAQKCRSQRIIITRLARMSCVTCVFPNQGTLLKVHKLMGKYFTTGTLFKASFASMRL